MKKAFLKIVVLCFTLLLTEQMFGQTVQVCIAVNGTAMPASRMYTICDNPTLNQFYAIPGAAASSIATLSLTNCAAIPETNVTYKWKNLSVGAHLDSLHNIITVKDTGKWEATIIDNVTLAIYKDTLHLVYYPHIAVTVHGPYDPSAYSNFSTQACPLFAINLTTTSSGPITNRSWYTVSPFAAISGETTSNYTFYTKNQKYLAVVQDINHCVNYDTSRYYALNPTVIQVNLGSDPPPVCEGTTTLLTSSVGFGYNCNGGFINYGINSTPKGSITISSTSTTIPPAPVDITSFLTPGTNTYWIRVDKFPYCSGSDSVTIIVKPIPVVDIGPPTVLACYGNNTTITANVSVGTAPYNYTWSPGSFPLTSSSIVISPTAPTTYTLQVTDVNNCSFGTDNVLVNVTSEIFVNISNDTTICRYPLGSAQLTTSTSGGTTPYTFAWSPSTDLTNPVNTATQASITARPTATTTYTMTATDNNNCTSSNSVKITSYQPPVAVIANPTTISETKTATLDVATSGNTGYDFKWKSTDSPTILENSSSIHLEYQGPDTVLYVCIVTNPSNGCQNNDTIAVWSISDNTLLYVPNIFSPNAANPENQKFRIYGDNLAPDDFKILVYNKWGNVVYESTDLMDTKSNGWDGGSKIEGVYTYVIVGKFKNGKDVQESKFNRGTFSLIK